MFQTITRLGLAGGLVLISICGMVSADTAKKEYQGLSAEGSAIVDKWDRFPGIVVPMAPAPKIDGVIDDREWAGASRISGLVSYQDFLLSREPSTCRLCHDGRALYVALRFERPSGADPKITADGPVESLWNKNDGVELCISPDKGGKMLFSLYGNASGGYSRGVNFGTSFDTSLGARIPVEYRSRFTGKAIEIEIKLPAESFADVAKQLGVTAEPVAAGSSWGLNPMRVDILPAKTQSDWSHMWGSVYSGLRLGRLIFAGDGTAASIDHAGALPDDRVGVLGTVTNGGSKPASYTVEYAIHKARQDLRSIRFSLYDAWDIIERFRTEGPMIAGLPPEQQIGETGWLDKVGRAFEPAAVKSVAVSVPAHESRKFTLALSQPSGQFIFACRVKDAAGKVLLSTTLPLEVKTGTELKLVKRFLTKGGVYLSADVSGTKNVKPGDTLSVSLKDARGKQSGAWKLPVVDVKKPVELFVNMERLGAGAYVLDATVSGTDGRLSYNKVEFEKPAVPSWWKNRIGYSDKVPGPWTPVQAQESKASVWGRSITFAEENSLPSSITSQGRELLSSPVVIEAAASGRPVAFARESFKLVSSTPRRAVYEGVYTSGTLRLKINTTVDYDGLVTFRMTPSGTGTLEKLFLKIPVKKEIAAWFGTSLTGTELSTAKVSYKAGKLPDFAKTFPGGDTTFNGLFFLGNGDIGLEWICEEDRYWSNADRSKQMRLDETGDSAVITAKFVDKPVDLSKPRTLTWSLMAAPVKDISWYYKYELNTANGVTGTSPKAFDEKAFLKSLAAYKGGGITHYLTGGWGTPFHADVWVRGHNRMNFEQSCRIAHERGMKVFYYGCWGYDVNGEEAKYFTDEMVKYPLEPCYPDTYWYNPEGPFADFFMAGLKWNMDTFKIDGIYLDGMPTTGLLFDPVMDEGYVDELGKSHGKWPIFALRSWAERMYAMMHEIERKDGIVYLHDSGMIPNLAVVSFADFRCGGEEAPSRDHLASAWPLDEYLVKYDERMYGIPVHTLWYNWWNRPIRENNVLAVTLLFGQLVNRTGSAVVPWNINKADYEKDTLPHIALLRLFKGFDVQSAEWHPYWRNGAYISMKPAGLKASMYLHPGRKALVIISNLDKDPVKGGQVTLGTSAMGIKGAFTVKDAFLGTTIPVAGNTVALDVQEERYRILLVEAAE